MSWNTHRSHPLKDSPFPCTRGMHEVLSRIPLVFTGRGLRWAGLIWRVSSFHFRHFPKQSSSFVHRIHLYITDLTHGENLASTIPQSLRIWSIASLEETKIYIFTIPNLMCHLFLACLYYMSNFDFLASNMPKSAMASLEKVAEILGGKSNCNIFNGTLK